LSQQIDPELFEKASDEKTPTIDQAGVHLLMLDAMRRLRKTISP
jgi:hypothetical protein